MQVNILMILWISLIKFNESKPTFITESYATFDWKTGKMKLSDLFIKRINLNIKMSHFGGSFYFI